MLFHINRIAWTYRFLTAPLPTSSSSPPPRPVSGTLGNAYEQRSDGELPREHTHTHVLPDTSETDIHGMWRIVLWGGRTWRRHNESQVDDSSQWSLGVFMSPRAASRGVTCNVTLGFNCRFSSISGLNLNVFRLCPQSFCCHWAPGPGIKPHVSSCFAPTAAKYQPGSCGLSNTHCTRLPGEHTVL